LETDYTPQHVAQLLRSGPLQLLDVREPHERQAGRIPGSLHVPLAELPERLEEIEREREVVVYCRSGGRSAMAAQALRQAGYDAHNMAGGLLEWNAAGLDMDPPGGYVADA
jgi:rhodanese-related sulfurtransferase